MIFFDKGERAHPKNCHLSTIKNPAIVAKIFQLIFLPFTRTQKAAKSTPYQ